MLKEIKKGFTLAEVLIVIGIIGVVAALTLPNLNHATGDKEKVTRVKKIYAALTDAVDRAQVIYGDFDTWNSDLSTDAEKSERFAKRVTEFMKISKDCGFDEGCFSSAPLLASNGGTYDDNYLSGLQQRQCYMVTLSDGTSLGFEGKVNGMEKIRVDIDGPNKGTNQSGKDIFDFSIYVSENRASLDEANLNQLYPSNALGIGGSPKYCDPYQYETTWVIENGNLDYLKCPEELDWNTKTSCE